MTPAEIKALLEAHAKWLRGEPGGSRANLTGANLTCAYLAGADLTCANLTDANLTGANLTDANLTGANLTGANLTDANLTCANLARADLTGANLAGADLTCANLTDANLTDANLTGANLTRADLTGAYLAGADLTCANLTDANLAGANLTCAYLTGAKNFAAREIAKRQILPAAGDLHVWKKLKGGTLCQLLIPDATPRVGGVVGRKCRAQMAVVVAGEGFSGGHPGQFQPVEYRVGVSVVADNWDPNPLVECSGGIHFFLTREEAEDYDL